MNTSPARESMSVYTLRRYCYVGQPLEGLMQLRIFAGLECSSIIVLDPGAGTRESLGDGGR